MENQETLPSLFPEIDEMEKEDILSPIRYRSYLASPFIAAALPLRDVRKNTFERKYNNLTLTLTGKSKIPYGRYGRLLLSVLTTHAVLEKSIEDSGVVELHYNSIQDLLNELQLPKQRGEQIKEQLDAFAQSTFYFEERKSKETQKLLFKDFFGDNEDLNGSIKATSVSTGIVPFFDAMRYGELDEAGKKTKTVAITIVLSEKFRRLSQEHAVPIDYTTYKEINSSLGKDLYAWFIYKNNAITEPVFISRAALVNQFFTEKNDVAAERHNWADLKDAIKEIKEKYYPGLNVAISKNNDGITLSKSEPVIINDDTRYFLISSVI